MALWVFASMAITVRLWWVRRKLRARADQENGGANAVEAGAPKSPVAVPGNIPPLPVWPRAIATADRVGMDRLMNIHDVMLRGLCIASVPALLLLVPIYVMGGNFYECGQPLSYLTISYLADAPSLEWTAAVLASLYVIMVSVSACRWLARPHKASLHDGPNTILAGGAIRPVASTAVPKWCAHTMFAVLVVMLCIPSALYAGTETVPPDFNTWSLTSTELWVAHQGASVILALINTVVLPWAVAHCEKANVSRKHMLLVSRMATTWVVPCAVYAVLANECGGFWTSMWTPCADMQAHLLDVTGFGGHFTSDYTALVNTTFVSTYDICHSPPSYGCFRGMVTMLMPLLLTKVAISAFVLSWAKSWAMWACSRIRRRKDTRAEERQASAVHAGEILAQLMTWCELGALLGFAVPLLVPLLALAVFANKLLLEIAVRSSTSRTGFTLNGLDELRVGPSAYVLAATMMTNAFTAGLFWNSNLQGAALVSIVSVVCTLTSAYAFFLRRRRRGGFGIVQWWRTCGGKVRNRYGSEVEMGDKIFLSTSSEEWDQDLGRSGVGDGKGEYHALEEKGD